jgi:antitoxin Phd
VYEMDYISYTVGMTSMSMSDARDNLAGAIETAQTEAVFLERYGQPAAVLISTEHYEGLMTAWDDAEDLAAFDAAIAEEGPNIPWDQAKADLGWT